MRSRVRFGYRRWTAAADGASLAPLHAACVRMVRADYGGADRPDQGTACASTFTTIAACSGPGGAVCVHHVRVSDNVTLTELETLYPRLRGRTGATCTEEFARAHGALVFNRSRP
jgi:hypothetical protein